MFSIGSSVLRVSFSAHLLLQISVLKMSKQCLFIASDAVNPVIFSAARLKEVILQLLSVVNIPSLILLNIILLSSSSILQNSILKFIPSYKAGISFLKSVKSTLIYLFAFCSLKKLNKILSGII